MWWEAAPLSQQRSLSHGFWTAGKPTRGALTLNPLNLFLLYHHTSPIPSGNSIFPRCRSNSYLFNYVTRLRRQQWLISLHHNADTVRYILKRQSISTNHHNVLGTTTHPKPTLKSGLGLEENRIFIGEKDRLLLRLTRIHFKLGSKSGQMVKNKHQLRKEGGIITTAQTLAWIWWVVYCQEQPQPWRQDPSDTLWTRPPPEQAIYWPRLSKNKLFLSSMWL